jgi:hypothetical protein
VVKARRIIDGDDLGRLRREAGMLMRIVAHPGLPMVRSDLVDGDRYCLISDYIAGNDLRTLVDAQGGGLPLPTVLGLVDQVAGTLDHLHRHRPAVVHGDVKPENLVLADDGRLVLVDFGAAMRVGEDGERLGTPGFSAPEVLAGEALSPAADVYSLAALCVYLLTGTVPRLGAAWPTELTDSGLERLERVLRRGLTWDPLGRPWSASEFAMRLRSAAEMDAPTGTITLVLIDVDSGATPRAESALGALEAAGGRVMTTVSLPATTALVAFSRAGDAAAAVLALAPVHASIALHAGDLGGWHGATLQQLADEAVALRRSATTPIIVCSPPVRMLLGSDDSLAFEPLTNGFRLQRPADSVQHGTAAATLSTGTGIAINGRASTWVASRRARPLVGRTHELRTANATIERGRRNGESPLVVALGEPGMGKTRFLAELAAGAVARSEHVLVGRCTESGGAFEPFLDAFGSELFPFESGQLERDEEGWIDRRRFFGRIADAVRALGGQVTLVIDDVQWIDGSSLALLAQLLDDHNQLAVLAGCRPSRSAVLDGLHQRSTSPPSRSAAAAGARRDVRQRRAQPDTLEGLLALTGGNPFFAATAGTPRAGTRCGAATPQVAVDANVDRLGDRAHPTGGVIGRFEVTRLLGVGPLGLGPPRCSVCGRCDRRRSPWRVPVRARHRPCQPGGQPVAGPPRDDARGHRATPGGTRRRPGSGAGAAPLAGGRPAGQPAARRRDRSGGCQSSHRAVGTRTSPERARSRTRRARVGRCNSRTRSSRGTSTGCPRPRRLLRLQPRGRHHAPLPRGCSGRIG